MLNFGVFSTPEGRVLFDINDFDETLPGIDFTVDIKRLAASVAVAALNANLPDKRARALAAATVKSYRTFILELALQPPLEVWYTRMDIDREVNRIGDAKLRETLFSTLVKAKKDLAADDNFPHLATAKAGVARIADRPPLIYHFDTAATKDYKFMRIPPSPITNPACSRSGAHLSNVTRLLTLPSKSSASAVSGHFAQSAFS